MQQKFLRKFDVNNKNFYSQSNVIIYLESDSKIVFYKFYKIFYI